MPFVKVDSVILGKSSLLRKMNRIADDAESKEGVFQALLQGGLMIQNTAVKSIVSTSPGSSTATRYGPERTVKVSPPGAPPNADTGRLHQSIKVAFNEGEKWVEVGTDVLYGAWLEFGTLTMPARPWLGPAYAKNRDRIIKMVQKVFKQSIKKAIQ